MKGKNKLSRLLEPGLRLYFIAMICFMLASAVMRDWYLALAEAVVIVALYV